MKRILLVSHDPVMFEDFCLFVKDNDLSHYFIDKASKGEEALAKIIGRTYDLVISDLMLNRTDMLGFIGKVRKAKPGLPIITYSFTFEYTFVKRYLTSGVNGYCFLKKGELSELVQAMDTVAAGKLFISPTMLDIIVDNALFGKMKDKFDSLNEKEFGILTQLVKGETLSGIAEIFNVHITTINLYKSRILDKLRVTSLFELRNMVKMEHSL